MQNPTQARMSVSSLTSLSFEAGSQTPHKDTQLTRKTLISQPQEKFQKSGP